jgi:hypothetical protein
VLDGGIEIISFEEPFTHAHVHVRGAAHHIRSALRRQAQAPLVVADRLRRTTLFGPDVTEGDGALDGVREMARRLQVRHGVRPCPVRRIEITVHPCGKG